MEKETYGSLLKERGVDTQKVFGFLEFKALENMPITPVVDDEVKKSDNQDSKENLFNQIYSVNPLTNLPQGDIAVFMNANTSPQVRDFIVNELMRPDGTEKATSFDGLSDDELYSLSRQHGEDIQAYKLRMFNVIRQGVQKKSSSATTE